MSATPARLAQNPQKTNDSPAFLKAAEAVGQRAGIEPQAVINSHFAALDSLSYPDEDCLLPSEVCDLLRGQLSARREAHIAQCGTCACLSEGLRTAQQADPHERW